MLLNKELVYGCAHQCKHFSVSCLLLFLGKHLFFVEFYRLQKKALKWSWPNFYITRSWQLKKKRLLISFSYPLHIIHNMTTATGESTKRQDIQEIGPNIQAYLIRRQCCRKAESCRRCSAEWIVQKDFLQHTRIKQLHMFRITSIMTHSDTTGRGEWWDS